MSLSLYNGSGNLSLERNSGGSNWYSSRSSRWEKRMTPGQYSSAGRDVWETTGTTAVPFNAPNYVDFPGLMSLYDVELFLKEMRLMELNDRILFHELELGDADIRPPSPAPEYDSEGARINTRDQLVRNNMLQEQQLLIEYMISHSSCFEPPPDFKMTKKVKRLLIPQTSYPDYNFMGLIIGPRGCNHKRLESESGAQISIRGLGTQKDGRKSDHQTNDEMALPQHVHIAADTEEKLLKAVQLIQPLLDPTHPIHEEYKKKGLQQLAQVIGQSGLPQAGSGGLMSGAGGSNLMLNRSDILCAICQQPGHYSFECPETKFETYERADVKCALCGDRGHVTSDCYIARERGYTPQDLAQILGAGGGGGGPVQPNFNASQYQTQSAYQGGGAGYQNPSVAQYFLQTTQYPTNLVTPAPPAYTPQTPPPPPSEQPPPHMPPPA